MKRALQLFLSLLFVALCACSTQIVRVPAGTACDAGSFRVIDGFVGARRGACRILAEDRVQLVILPEDDKVKNPSPWYAFKLEPAGTGPTTAHILLDYGSWPHRYWPKVSSDGLTWQALPARAVTVDSDGHGAEVTVALDAEPVWVSAQELITPPMYELWIRLAARTHDVTRALLGESRGGQAITVLDSNGDSKDIVLLVGRQHPPEVSGAFAFFTFWETLFDDTDLANKFRDRFRVISVPLLNPDGVAAGNWRHNLGDTDLNRDWGPFVQPETQLIENLLADLDRTNFRIRAFIDFHSTERNLFYTQADSDPTQPLNFSRDWLENSRARIVSYEFTNEARATSDTANGKNYMYKRYGVPSVTYEVGDETDRHATEAAAVIFAEEFMKLLLQHAGG
jgi:predicted deacylase